MPIQLPNQWRPRQYQRALWDYLERGGKRAVAVWHRRAGKDDVCLHRTCIAAHERVGNYWHMLPEKEQARKAIWNAVDAQTGIRRVDQAFPQELRASTNDQEMFIRFKNGSTWQVVGSDNYNSLVGAGVVGVVFSEFSLANPNAWGYISPILVANGGWALFIYTPRGKTHGYDLYKGALNKPSWFAEKLTIDDTKALDDEALEAIRDDPLMTAEKFEQEYLCSFDAAIPGAVYGRQMTQVERDGRVVDNLYNPDARVYTGWDLGFGNNTAIWFYQISGRELHLIDFYENALKDIEFYVDKVHEMGFAKGYKYGAHYAPHDARNRIQAAGGRSIVELADARGLTFQVVPSTSQENQIEAVRFALKHAWFARVETDAARELVKGYHFPFDEKTRTYAKAPKHDFTSDCCDALEIVARVWQDNTPKPVQAKPPIRSLHDMTADELFWPERKAETRVRI